MNLAHITPLAHGTTVDVNAFNRLVDKVNELVDVVNGHPARQGLDCPTCAGFGYISTASGHAQCPACHGTGIVDA